MQNCQQCGALVTPAFVRVFGSDGEVYACPSCATIAALIDGAGEADGPERDA
ncbi:MAG TPA: hypothetical protein VKA37_12285 [Halobacteriales archaeon]|nr:hypothetical protein [Halobacteriales archaeon]